VKLLRENPEKIHWEVLSKNPNPEAMKILKEHPEKIDLYDLSLNPGIWIDTYKVAQREYFCKSIAEELIAKVWNPKNIDKFKGLGYDFLEED
jgi:hypothetical protein